MSLKAPQKRKASQDLSIPTRKSRRIAGLDAESKELAQTGASELESGPDCLPSTISALSALPELPDDWEKLKAQALQRLSEYIPERKDDENLVACLRAFLEWLPADGQESLARDLVTCVTDQKIYELFLNLRNGLLYTMKASSRSSSVISSPVPERQDNMEKAASALPYLESRDPKFRASCLRRDNYRCVVTGQMCFSHWEEIGEPEDTICADLEAAHIIPFSYASWNAASLSAEKDVSGAWEVLWRCFPGVRRAGMSVEEINDPSNGITLRDNIHKRFGKFRFALVPTDEKHVYAIKLYRKFPLSDRNMLPKDERVELRAAPGEEGLALPNPALLDCHYRVAEILNASGMGEEIEKKINEWEDMRDYEARGCLALDGSSDLEKFLSVGLWGSITG